MTTKRFALLSGQTYYPAPGWLGFDSWHDTIEEAVQKGQTTSGDSYEWFQVLDTSDFTIVAGHGDGHTGLFGKISAGPSAT